MKRPKPNYNNNGHCDLVAVSQTILFIICCPSYFFTNLPVFTFKHQS